MASKFGELLVTKGFISKSQLDGAVENQRKHNIRLSTSLIQLGHINEKVLATFFSKEYGVTAISLESTPISEKVLKIIPRKICDKHCLIPINADGNKLLIAISDPTNIMAVEDIRFLSKMEPIIHVARESSIKVAIEKFYKNAELALTKIIEPDKKGAAKKEEDISVTQELENIISGLSEDDDNTNVIQVGVETSAQDIESDTVGAKPVIRLMNKLFFEAIRRGVSDIHIEPFENYSRVRFRIDGSMHEIMRLPPQLKISVPARIKVMSSLNISEKRLPQDGRMQLSTKSSKLDVRVSVLPTIRGEKVVMRILASSVDLKDLSSIGFEDEQLKLFRKAATQPYGMILVTGPTGSGKSTTLYAALAELNQPDVNISTVEDPVEIKMEGVNQVQTKDPIGFTFASALRSFLRQDPDIIMVGEIRDQDTAEIAIKAALTGHMVLSTLHTNDAPSTISRLLHMGIEPFLITAALTLVQAQRLIRVNCKGCVDVDSTFKMEQALAAEMPENWIETFKPKRGKGCDKCAGTGYKGRQGIFEVMYMTESLREMVIKGNNADELRAAALEDGMITLRQNALMKLYRGETTLEEVLNNSRPDGDLLK